MISSKLKNYNSHFIVSARRTGDIMKICSISMQLNFLARALGTICLSLMLGCEVSPASLKEAIVADEKGSSSSPSPQAPTPTPTPTLTPPQAPANPNGKTLIELVKCEAIAESISKYKMSVSYRFVSGSPKPNLSYTIMVIFPGCPFQETKVLSGKDLKMEGTLEWLYELPGIGARGDSEATSAIFQFSEEYDRVENRTGYLGVSKQTTVKVDMSRIGL